MANIFCHEKLLAAIKELPSVSKLEGSAELGAKMATCDDVEKLIDLFSAEKLIDSFLSLKNHLFTFCYGDKLFLNRFGDNVKRAGRIVAVRRMW